MLFVVNVTRKALAEVLVYLGKYRSVTIGTEAAIWLPNLMLNHSQNIIAFARHAAKR